MGVPSYFSWLVQRFKNEILRDLKANPNIVVHALYLDLNCAIHPAVKKDGLSRADMYKEVLNAINEIVKACTPTELLYIAIDGVAPRAKMQQQRKRRFKSVLEKTEILAIKEKYKIPVDTQREAHDFNMISPGTEFMAELAQYLTANLPIWQSKLAKGGKTFKIHFDGADNPGEGEHKIMNYLRAKEAERQSKTVAIYGLDADLIFLSLTNWAPSTYLLREKVFFGKDKSEKSDGPDEYTYLSIDSLRDCLLRILNPYVTLADLAKYGLLGDTLGEITSPPANYGETLAKAKVYTQPHEEDNLILDWVVMCFFLGNDFLPPLPSLVIREGGLDQLIRAYKETQALRLGYLIRLPTKGDSSKDYEVNLPCLRALLSRLGVWEDEALRRSTQNRQHRIQRFWKSDDYLNAEPYGRAMMEWEYIEKDVVDRLQMGYSGWYERYYGDLVRVVGRDSLQDEKSSMIEDYWGGIMWTLRYYVTDCTDWQWTYVHHLAPTVSDMYKSLSSGYDPNSVQICHNAPVTAVEQLLMILPQDSVALLEPKYRHLMTDWKSPIIHYYPINYKLAVDRCRFRWEAHPILPDIDQNLIGEVSRL